jgi:hypothetical protein
MTVKELIELLEKEDPNAVAKVEVPGNGRFDPPQKYDARRVIHESPRCLSRVVVVAD